MNARVLLALLCLGASAFAGLDIKKARYGNNTNYRDVRAVIDAYVRNNTLSFVVNARSMGGDPNGHKNDSLFIVYEVNDREYIDTVSEGGVFTFKGIPGVKPAHALLHLPLLRPAAPLTAPLVIANRSEFPLRIYSVDRFGQWVWTSNLGRGDTLTVNGQVGQEWIAADYSNRILGRNRIARGDNQLWVSDPGVAPPVGGFRGGEAWVRFESKSPRPLYLYNLDSSGRWNWMALIEPGGVYPASTRMGETWIATDTANHVVRQTTVAPGISRVQLN